MTKIVWYGHSCYKIDNVLIDPFIQNPLCDIPHKEIMDGVDVIAITHGHGDHIGNAEWLSKTYNVPIVAIYEVATYLGNDDVETIGMNIGGTVNINGAKIKMVKAEHSSDIDLNTPGGIAAGYIINDRVYHSGDTGLFGDMKLIGDIYKPDIVILPVGGRYTMGPEEVPYAIKMLSPKVFIPMHYNTFPEIEIDIDNLIKTVEGLGVKVIKPKVGEVLEI